MGSVPRKQQQNPFVEKVVVQSAPMEDTKHGVKERWKAINSAQSVRTTCASNDKGVPSDSTKNQVAVKSMHRPRAIPQKLNGNNASNNSSPNTPRFAGSPFTSLEADAELPDVMSEQAAPTAAIKLQYLLSQLENGKAPNISEMKTTIRYAAEVLSQHSTDLDSDENFDEVQDEEVRAWLATTFTKKESVYTRQTSSQVPRFKTVAQLLVIGNYVHSRYKWASQSGLQVPNEVATYLLDHAYNWNFDIFHFEKLTNSQPLRYTTYALCQKCELPKRHEILVNVLDNFLVAIENGYKRYKNPYHNSTHAADVVQTVYCLIKGTGLMEWMTTLEILAILIAAAIHDVEHTGTTNSFHIHSNSEFALLYNDRSVLENHHLYTAFKLMKDTKDANIFKSLKPDDYRLVRGLIIDMVMATDMSCHFEQVKYMKNMLTSPEAYSVLDKSDRSKVLSMVLHCADISHPGKPWELHSKWTPLLMEEFFRQGDQEKELKRQCSPLCDRNTTLVPESQIGFIDVIVIPTYEVMGNMIDLIMASYNKVCKEGGSPTMLKYDADFKPWSACLSNNKKQWKDRCSTKARTSQTNSDQSKTSTVETRKSSTVETKKISQMETTKTTENGDTCHKVSTVETHQISKPEDHKIITKDNENSEISNPAAAAAAANDSHHSNGDTHNDLSLPNNPASLDANNDHQKPSLKNLENS